jgi:glycosyltransferase 2 family protein
MQAPARRPGPGWKFWLRIAVSAGLLVVLVVKVRDMGHILPTGHPRRTLILLGLALLATFIGVVLSSWRWQAVLRAFDVEAPLPILTGHYFAGLFVGNVLPSTIGGDVVRVARASDTTGSSSVAFASVAIERLSGFIALPLLVVLGLIAGPATLDKDHAWLALLVAGITLGALGLILLLVGHPKLAGRFAERDNWTRFVGAVHLGVDTLRHRPRQARFVLLTAVVYQTSVVISFALIFRALDMPVPVAATFAYVPAVAMVQVLPLSLMGLGVREGMLSLFLHTAWGVPTGTAVAAGLLWFACMLLVSMAGAPNFVMGGGRKGRDAIAEPAETRELVAEDAR